MISVKKRTLGMLAACVFAAGIAHAQESAYPSRTVNVILGYSPGGSGDTIARLVSDELSAALGQSFVVQNRAGAAGIIAAEYVAKSPADGYTLLSGSSTELAVNVSAYKKLPYDPVKNFTPIIQYSVQPNVLMVSSNSKLPINSVKELIAYAKAHPGKVSYGSAGNGSTQHISVEMLEMLTGIELLHVPYKGGANAITDLIGGQIDINLSPLPEAVEHVRLFYLSCYGRVVGNSKGDAFDAI